MKGTYRKAELVFGLAESVRPSARRRMTMNSKQAIFITGSSTGFGRLFADILARKGHTVFATMRDTGGRNAKNDPRAYGKGFAADMRS